MILLSKESADILAESSTQCKNENCKENITRAPKALFRHKVQRCMDERSARREAPSFCGKSIESLFQVMRSFQMIYYICVYVNVNRGNKCEIRK
mmetsp:Transcript_21239/g.44877  ORF Transcript_21239/g.44877 Transcript_21239/m.44877 type:complete len:94 (+) Transcript_21239:587-868(+)